MKDYKRLTKWSELGTLHVFDINGKEIPLYDVSPVDTDNLAGRLADLEDKIERGELISTMQAVKEFADKIITSGTTVYDPLRCKEFIKLPMERYKKLIKEVCGE